MVVKRFRSIMLTGFISITSINGGGARGPDGERNSYYLAIDDDECTTDSKISCVL